MGRARVSVAELADDLAVSAGMIRKDLAALESRGLLQRIHGGAVAPVGPDEGPFGVRLHTNGTVIMPGGACSAGRPPPWSADARTFLEGRGRLVRGFFGASGASETLGLLEISPEEAETKRQLIAACREVVALCGSDKFTGFGLHSFAGPRAISTIITDSNAAPEALAAWRALGVEVERASSS